MKRLIVLAFMVSACQAEPRSASYFQAHPDDARRVVDACRQGAHRGAECDHAKAGQAATQADKRMELFKKSFE